MGAVLCVGVGGFVGAVLRYGMGLVPFAGAFPWATFAVNLLGAVAIGALAEASDARRGSRPRRCCSSRRACAAASPRSRRSLSRPSSFWRAAN